MARVHSLDDAKPYFRRCASLAQAFESCPPAPDAVVNMPAIDFIRMINGVTIVAPKPAIARKPVWSVRLSLGLRRLAPAEP